MSLMHPALLAGIGMAIIPILLHLLLRAKPKRLIFPALRLIQQNRRQNVRRMQLRHLWLLLLRILVIALIAIALTRPSLPAANYSFVLSEWLTLLAVIGLGIGAYFVTLNSWKRRAWPRNRLLTLRTMLRGGLGAVTVLLLLLAVGWPYARRVSAEIKAPAPKLADNIPVAAVFLFDSSPSMNYRQGNQTRLQVAQQIGRDHLSRFPSGSKVAITDLHDTASAAFSLDLQAARTKIDAREIKPGGLSLNDRLRSVLMMQEEDRRRATAEQGGPEEKRQDRFLREIYLFTDLAKSAWRDETSTLLRDELRRLETVSLYLIDVGEPSPTNVGITDIRLQRESVPAGGTMRFDAVISGTGDVKPEQTVEIFLNGPDNKPAKIRQQEVTLESNVPRRLTFDIPKIQGRFQQGEIRIVGSDPLAIDDVGYFTVRTMSPLNVLIVAEPPAGYYWEYALKTLSSEGITDFRPTMLAPSRLRTEDLSKRDVVCLLNVPTLEDAAWVKLRDFVTNGGGLAVFLGADSAVNASNRSKRTLIDQTGYNSITAQSVLPAQLMAQLKFPTPQTIDLRDTQHPLLKRLNDSGDNQALTELGAIVIHKYWVVAPNEAASVIARYGDPRSVPALVERRIGQGRVMLMSTSIDDPDWNDLIGQWYLVLADQLMQYLSQQASTRSNYLVGDDVNLPVDHNMSLKKVVVRMPDFRQRTSELTEGLLLRDLNSVGSYQVDSSDPAVDYHAGFSMNLSARESDLRRTEKSDLDSLLGEGRYTINRDPGSLERNVQTGRLGQEVYSLVVAILVFIFALEQFTANWFYQTDNA